MYVWLISLLLLKYYLWVLITTMGNACCKDHSIVVFYLFIVVKKMNIVIMFILLLLFRVSVQNFIHLFQHIQIFFLIGIKKKKKSPYKRNSYTILVFRTHLQMSSLNLWELKCFRFLIAESMVLCLTAQTIIVSLGQNITFTKSDFLYFDQKYPCSDCPAKLKPKTPNTSVILWNTMDNIIYNLYYI